MWVIKDKKTGKLWNEEFGLAQIWLDYIKAETYFGIRGIYETDFEIIEVELKEVM